MNERISSYSDHALVSVVIPSYNYGRFAAACLSSVCEQSYQNLELVVVDDASEPETWNEISRLLEASELMSRFQHRVTKHRHEQNQGAHATLNTAIRLSRGDFVAILNADDEYEPKWVATLVDALNAAPRRGLAFGKLHVIDAEGRDISGRDFSTLRLSNLSEHIGAYPSVGFAFLAENISGSSGNLLFRRELFDEVGGFRPLRFCHDWDFALRCVLRTEPVFVPEAAYRYRIHDTNTIHSLDALQAESETYCVLTDFFRAVNACEGRNELAPSPDGWPFVFERLLSNLGLDRFWRLARGARELLESPSEVLRTRRSILYESHPELLNTPRPRPAETLEATRPDAEPLSSPNPHSSIAQSHGNSHLRDGNDEGQSPESEQLQDSASPADAE